MPRKVSTTLVGALAAFAFAAVLPSAGRATSFGADLTLPANGTRTCSQGFFPDPFMAQVVGVAFPSCTWWSAGSLSPGQGDALVPSGGGVLTHVRVKVGPVTGRMQVLVLRQRRHPNVGTAACCFYVASTPVFTPAANGVTEIQTSIPVQNGYDSASGLENFDLLALSSLDAGVPVPSWLGGNGYTGGAIGGVFPSWTTGVEQVPGYGMVAFGQVLVAGDVEPPVTTGTGTTTTTGTRPAVTPVTLTPGRSASLRSANRVAELPLRCRSSLPCAGRVRLQSRSATASAARVADYGSASFTLKPRASGRVQVKLSTVARNALRRTHRLVAYANITIAGKRYAGLKVTLRMR
jgi:hypothetical protein